MVNAAIAYFVYSSAIISNLTLMRLRYAALHLNLTDDELQDYFKSIPMWLRLFIRFTSMVNLSLKDKKRGYLEKLGQPLLLVLFLVVSVPVLLYFFFPTQNENLTLYRATGTLLLCITTVSLFIGHWVVSGIHKKY